MGLFGTKAGGPDSGSQHARTSRYSSGWVQMAKFLRAEESLRILDFGPTSAGNINFITNLGHSIYMANLVDDAAKAEYVKAASDGEEAAFDIERFLAENLEFHGRTFNVILLWDTFDYLPRKVVEAVADRLSEVMTPGGQLLALFHSSSSSSSSMSQKFSPEDAIFSRYHLTDTDKLDLQRVGGRPMLHTLTNREIEAIFHQYSGYKFFLAKDNLREVIVTR